MRVALVNHRDWIEGGMDKVALTHLKRLNAMGHTAELYTRFDDQRNRETPYRRYFPKLPDYTGETRQWASLSTLPRQSMALIYNRQVGECFGRFLDRFMPDVVHVHGLPRSFTPAIYDAARQRRIPVVQTHHYTKLVCPTGQLLRGEENYCTTMPCLSGNTLSCALNRCQQKSLPRSLMAALELRWNRERYIHRPDLHLAPSQYLYDLLLKAGVPQNKLRLHANFVDLQRFHPAEKPTQDYYLYFGRLAHEKGIETLIDAFAPLQNLKLILAGDGPLATWVMARTQDLPNIHWIGPQPEDTLVPLVQHARCTILPSLWGEIFGLSVIESMACGRPIIGSAVGAITELIAHGKNGLLVPPGKIGALQKAVLDIHTMPQASLQAMGAAGLHLAQRCFGLDRHLDALLTHYHDILEVSA